MDGSLCHCGRSRYRPGYPCTACRVEKEKRRRLKIRNGAPPKTRVRDPGAAESPRYARPLRADRFLITSAQNATPVHKGFLAALRVAAKHLGAELVVVPIRYKNPTSVWTSDQESDEHWAPEIEPYLYNVRKKLNRNLILCADVKVQPTASSPLTGFEALTGAESCIIGHPKMQFRSVPAPSGRYPKILSTTGSITRQNFTDSKAGKLGAFHHFLGAVIVEIEGKRFHLRQLNADRTTGEFTDLATHYTAAGARAAPSALGIVFGDTHARMVCALVDEATFGPGGIVDTLNPETLVFGDLFDGWSINPHHAGNPFIAAAKYNGGANVHAEVEHAIKFVRDRCAGRKAVIVGSNHDAFLARWIISTDWRTAPGNAAFYLETAQAMLASVRLTPGGAEYSDPFLYWVNRLKGDADIHALARDESFKLADIECGLHGHEGPNGSRGTLRNLSRLGGKVISGHSHTPGIQEGHYQVGTSTPLRLEYTSGPSSWQNAHAVVYANGKRSLILVIDGRWRVPISGRKKK